jgi:hypothetical protein
MGKPPQPGSKKQPTTPLTTNQKVVVWTRGKLGRKVGRGECWDLAEEALKQANAHSSNDLGSVDEHSDYVWGDPIEQLKDIEPGDVLQFRDHEVTTLTKTEISFADGSGSEQTKEETAERRHHTAIVNGKPDSKGAVATLEQRVKPKGKVVQEKLLYTRDVEAMKTTVSKKLKHPSSKKLEPATVVTTVTIKVTGRIWAYRPKPK